MSFRSGARRCAPGDARLRRRVLLVASVLVPAALVGGCSGNELSIAAPTTTTSPPKSRPPVDTTPRSTTPRSSAPQTSVPRQVPPTSSGANGPTTTTTTPSAGSGDSLPGLWISLGVSINDERGTQYARAKAGEMLRDPVDDGAGGVIYLRCADETENCVIEQVAERDGKAKRLGEATKLLAVGSFTGRRALLSGWLDPAVSPNSATDTSGQFGRVIDIDQVKVLATYDWFGWESGPFVADVETDQFILCQGEGMACGLSVRPGDGAAADQPFTDVRAAEVTSVSLDRAGKVATWVATDPDTGSTDVSVRDLATGSTTTTNLLKAGQAPPGDTDTDGAWVALLVGERIQLREIAGSKQRGQLVAPPGVLSIALRTQSSASSGPSPL